MKTSEQTLDVAVLEALYDDLAQAIDAAGADKSSVFLVKLALLQARDGGSLERFRALVAEALQDL